MRHAHFDLCHFNTNRVLWCIDMMKIHDTLGRQHFIMSVIFLARSCFICYTEERTWNGRHSASTRNWYFFKLTACSLWVAFITLWNQEWSRCGMQLMESNVKKLFLEVYCLILLLIRIDEQHTINILTH